MTSHDFLTSSIGEFWIVGWGGGKVTLPEKLTFLCEPANVVSWKLTFLLDCILSYRDTELGSREGSVPQDVSSYWMIDS